MTAASLANSSRNNTPVVSPCFLMFHLIWCLFQKLWYQIKTPQADPHSRWLWIHGTSWPPHYKCRFKKQQPWTVSTVQPWSASPWLNRIWLADKNTTDGDFIQSPFTAFLPLFGLLTRWTLKINAVNSENLPAGVPGDFILFIHLLIYFQTKTPLMCLGSFNQKVLCLLLHGGQHKQNPDQRWWWWWRSGGGLFLRGYRLRRDPCTGRVEWRMSQGDGEGEAVGAESRSTGHFQRWLRPPGVNHACER